MKKIVTILAAVLLTAAAASSQENHFRIGIGGYPLVPSLMINGIGAYPDDYYPYPPALGSIYNDYEGVSYTTGNIYGEYAWNIKKWFTTSVSASTDIIWTNRHDALTGARVDTQSAALVHIMGKAQFNWVSREIVRMYSSVSLGFITSFGAHSFGISPGIQFTPVGIEVGKKIFGFGEAGFGTTYVGGMVGIGYRF